MSNPNASQSVSTPIVGRLEIGSTMPLSPTPPTDVNEHASISSFWRNRFFESGLILSMALYYFVANPNISMSVLPKINPLFSLPFLLVFAVLCWFRLPVAIALLPLSLPFYLFQKTVAGHWNFSLAEIALGTCLVVAALRLLFMREDRRLLLSWPVLRARVGPFWLPVLVFVAAAAFSIVIAYEHHIAWLAFRKEVFGPLLYLGLTFLYLRSRQDVLRLLSAMLGTGLMIALLGIMQYTIFKDTLVLEDGVRRVHAVYGSANSIGLLFDYILPLGLALVMAKVSRKARLVGLILCAVMLPVLYLSNSLGAWLAIPVAATLVVVLSIRQRKILVIGGSVFAIVLVSALLLFHTQIVKKVETWHINTQGFSTVEKRLYLWQSALNMIHDSPWVGYGMDNWLCHYSNSWFNVCLFPAGPPHQNGPYQPNPPHPKLHAYWITNDPVTGKSTGMSDEPWLSHPHNIFLHVWVSMGIFGLLAFVSVLILFFWLFARLLIFLRTHKIEHGEQLRWMTVGVGAAMLAALLQGQIDSAFLEQDLAFCFWILVASLLLLRTLSGMPWRNVLPQHNH